jgi:hypothetical protein
MLFVSREGISFRAPHVGVSGADLKSDPLEPITIVDGVPFLTFQGRYLLGGGAPEEPVNYLLFCITHCNWSEYRYAPKSMAEKRGALEKVLAHWSIPELRASWEDKLRPQIELR